LDELSNTELCMNIFIVSLCCALHYYWLLYWMSLLLNVKSRCWMVTI